MYVYTSRTARIASHSCARYAEGMPLPPPLVTTSLRLPPHLVRRIDRALARMREVTPGAHLSRSDAIRNLVIAGLAHIEAAHVVADADDPPASPDASGQYEIGNQRDAMP